MIDILSGILIGFGAGAGAGALSALLGWAASNDPFDGKKFGLGLATGAIAGMGVVELAIPALKASLEQDSTGTGFALLMIPIVLGIIATDQVRAKVSAMVANRQPTPTTLKSG